MARTVRTAVNIRRARKQRRVDMTPLQAWQGQFDRLSSSIARLEAAPTMHGDFWRDRQVAYFRKLLKQLQEKKPRK